MLPRQRPHRRYRRAVDTADAVSAIVAHLPSPRGHRGRHHRGTGRGRKSTLAAALAQRIAADGRRTAVVATDGFLWPNAVLVERGLLDQKGIPATYDLDALDALLAAARDGRSPLSVPQYSHRCYDVETTPLALERPDVLVVEGVVALQRPFGDLAVYLDADDADVEGWYVERFRALVADAAVDPGSFYRAWVGLPADEVDAVARLVWAAVNLPNLREHIRPTMASADLVVRKGPDHTITAVRPVAAGREVRPRADRSLP